MSDRVKITYYGLYKEANRLLDKSKISLGEYERMIEPLNEEVRKEGYWISHGDDQCSECGMSFPDLYPLYNSASYCPNCGARMKGASDEHNTERD